MTASAKYDVYGAKRAGGTGTATSRQGFVGGLGHVTDDETGLIYMRARYYDPGMGRFISQDPSKNGENWFAYGDDNPVNELDQTGKAAVFGALMVILGALAYFTGTKLEQDIIKSIASVVAVVTEMKNLGEILKTVGEVNTKEGDLVGILQTAGAAALFNGAAMLGAAYAVFMIQTTIALALTDPDEPGGSISFY